VAAVLMLMGLRWVFGFVSKTHMRMLSPVFCAAAMLVTGTAVAVSGHSFAKDITITLCEMTIAATASLLFFKARTGFENAQEFSGVYAVSAVFLMAVVYMGRSGIAFADLYPVHIVAAWVLLCVGYRARTGAGAVAGIVAGLAAALTGQTLCWRYSRSAAFARVSLRPMEKRGRDRADLRVSHRDCAGRRK
jgi:hypothetical protein